MLFLKGIGGWLLKNPALIACALLLAAFAMLVISKNAEIRTLRSVGHEKDARIETLVGSLGQARANVATLNASLITQSASIAALEQQGVAAGAKFDQLMTGMATANATTARKLDAIDKAKPGPDICKSAFELMKGAAR